MKNIPKPNVELVAEHSEYSPSGSKRWINCPASIHMLRSIEKKESSSNFYAEEGTCAHELGAFCLDEDISAEECIGNTFNQMVIDKDMAVEVQKYIDYVKGQLTWESILWVENRLSLEFIQKEMFGTADAVIFSENSLEIIDLKYGKGVVVEPEDNTQLMLYAIGVLAYLYKHGVKFDLSFDVKLTIFQPRAPHENGPVRSAYVTVAQLKDIQQICIDAIAKSNSADPTFGPGEEQCRWCEAAPFCKPYMDYNLELARLEFADFYLEKEPFKKKLVKANTVDNDIILEILKHDKAITNWLKGLKEYLISQLSEGKKVSHRKLVYGRSNRAYRDETEVQKILKEYGTDESRIFKSKFLSPAQLEKELTKEEWDLVKELIYKPQGNITMALDTDPRPAVNTLDETKEEWSDSETS